MDRFKFKSNPICCYIKNGQTLRAHTSAQIAKGSKNEKIFQEKIVEQRGEAVHTKTKKKIGKTSIRIVEHFYPPIEALCW